MEGGGISCKLQDIPGTPHIIPNSPRLRKILSIPHTVPNFPGLGSKPQGVLAYLFEKCSAIAFLAMISRANLPTFSLLKPMNQHEA